GSTIDFNSSVAQTIPAFAYNNLTSSGSGARTLDTSGAIKIAGTFTPGTNAYTFAGSTIEYNGAGAQTAPAAFATYENLTISNAAGVTLGGNTTVNTSCTVNSGATLVTGTSILGGAGSFTLAFGAGLTIGSAAGITAADGGNIQTSGGRSYSTGANYTYNGSAAQATGDGLPATVNNLTINNSAGVTLT